MANFVTIFRIFVMFYAIYLIVANQSNKLSYILALVLTIIAFALDGVDGYLARKLHEESKLGAILDIMSDRIVENVYWIVFAVLGWISILFPLIAITRGFITDAIRSVAMEQGFTAFGEASMQKNPICKFITCSKFMRITYAVAKVLAFILIIMAYVPEIPFAEQIKIIGYYSAIIAISLCVIRGIPVVVESGYLFKNDKN